MEFRVLSLNPFASLVANPAQSRLESSLEFRGEEDAIRKGTIPKGDDASELPSQTWSDPPARDLALASSFDHIHLVQCRHA
jgi:hypothetical protein